MALKIADRSRVPPFLVMDVLRAAGERARAGDDIIRLEAGQPSSPAPAAVLAAAAEALDQDRIGYTDAFGVPTLREAIAHHYADAYGQSVDPARVAVTVGSSAGFLLSFLTAFAPGDRVAMATPSYPAYRHTLTALGVQPVPLPTTAADRYQPTVAHLDAVEGPLDGLILASPSNPTGTMVTPDRLAELAAWCRRHGVRLISDELYHGITYGTREATALAHDPDAVVIHSFSKYFCMTGWRLGWMVLPPDMLRPIECLAQNLFISPPTLSQLAAIQAFASHDELRAHVDTYARHRALLLEALPQAGLPDIAPPDGGFYAWVDVSAHTDDSVAWAGRLLDEAGVAVTPGVDFDPVDGRRFVRLSYAGTERDVVEGCRRIGAWLNR